MKSRDLVHSLPIAALVGVLVVLNADRFLRDLTPSRTRAAIAATFARLR